LFIDDGTIEKSYQCPSDTFIQEIHTENNGVNGALSGIGVICSLNPNKEVMTNFFTKQNSAWMRFGKRVTLTNLWRFFSLQLRKDFEIFLCYIIDYST